MKKEVIVSVRESHIMVGEPRGAGFAMEREGQDLSDEALNFIGRAFACGAWQQNHPKVIIKRHT